MIIKSDILLALILPMDKHHVEALKLVDGYVGDVKVSPYSFIELDLLPKSGEIIVADTPAFYEALSVLLKYRMIGTYLLKPKYHSEASKLRNKHKTLIYFDSFHAGVAMVEDLELVSYDKVYEEISEVKFIRPEKPVK